MPDPLAQQVEGAELFVRKAEIEYFGSAGFDDELDIGVRCEKIGRSSIATKLAIFRADELLIEGSLVYANATSKQSVKVPQFWRDRIGALSPLNPS